MTNESDLYINAKEITTLDIFYSTCKYISTLPNILHPHVEWILQTNNSYNLQPKYKQICCYIFYNKNTNKFYIGSGNLDVRKKDHLRKLELNKHANIKFQNAFNVDSYFEFHYCLIPTRKQAFIAEQYLLDHFYHNECCLNIAEFIEAPTIGITYSNERREQIKKNNFKMWSNPKHYNKVFTEEARDKQRLNLLGNKYSVGLKHTDETKNKISNTLINKFKNNPEYSKNISIRNKNRWEKLSIEEKNKRKELGRDITTNLWKNKEYRTKVISRIKESFNKPEIRMLRSKISKEYSNRSEVKERRKNQTMNNWKNNDFRNKVTTAIKESANTPERKLEQSIISKEYHNRPEVKEKKSKFFKEFANRPENKKRISDRNKEKWKDKEYRENQIKRLKDQSLSRCKKMIINNEKFNSFEEVRKKFNVSYDYIKRRLESLDFPNWKYSNN